MRFSKKLLDQAKEKKHFGWHSPMLAVLMKKTFSHKDWIFERKLDGVRCLVYKKNGKVTLYSRNKKSLNQSYPELVELFAKQKAKNFVVDGEIVAFEGKQTSFSKLQSRMHIKDPQKIKARKVSVHFYAFDLVFFDRYDLRALPLIERKRALKSALRFQGKLHYTSHVQAQGEKYFQQASKKGWEGVIAKKKNSKYRSTRTKAWQKFKCENGQEFVIAGYTSPQGSRIGFGALILGYYEKGVLQYAGKVGTGYDIAMLKKLGRRLKSIERKTPHFKGQKIPKALHFVQPKLVCEVKFTEWTKEGRLRHPRFIGLRSDKSPRSVRRERR